MCILYYNVQRSKFFEIPLVRYEGLYCSIVDLFTHCLFVVVLLRGASITAHHRIINKQQPPSRLPPPRSRSLIPLFNLRAGVNYRFLASILCQ